MLVSPSVLFLHSLVMPQILPLRCLFLTLAQRRLSSLLFTPSQQVLSARFPVTQNQTVSPRSYTAPPTIGRSISPVPSYVQATCSVAHNPISPPVIPVSSISPIGEGASSPTPETGRVGILHQRSSSETQWARCL